MLQRKDRLFYKTHTTDIEYYKVMKEFQVEAEGTPINSEKYIRLRNKYHRKLAMQPSETNKYNETPNQIDYLRFYIAVCPELLECYQLIIILNYNKVLYKAFEDSILGKSIIGQMLGREYIKVYKNYSFPLIKMETNDIRDLYIQDKYNNIIEFLIANKFIKEFRTFSAYEKNGLEFANKLQAFFEIHILKILNRLTFYIKSANFKECEYGYQSNPGYHYFKRFRSKIGRFLYFFFINLKDYIKNYNTIRNKNQFRKDLKNLIIEWSNRLNNNVFHGGDVPDEADFKVYSIFKMYRNCSNVDTTIQRLCSYELNSNDNDFYKINLFSDWESKMNLLCERKYNSVKDIEFSYSILNTDETGFYNQYKVKKFEDRKEDIRLSTNAKGAFMGNSKRGKVAI